MRESVKSSSIRKLTENRLENGFLIFQFTEMRSQKWKKLIKFMVFPRGMITKICNTVNLLIYYHIILLHTLHIHTHTQANITLHYNTIMIYSSFTYCNLYADLYVCLCETYIYMQSHVYVKRRILWDGRN